MRIGRYDGDTHCYQDSDDGSQPGGGLWLHRPRRGRCVSLVPASSGTPSHGRMATGRSTCGPVEGGEMIAHACARGRRPDGAAHTRVPFKYVGPARLCKTQQRCYHRPPMGGGVTCRGGTPLKPSGRPDSHRIATCAVARVVRGWRAAARGRARRRGAVAYAACGDGARSHAAVRETA